MNAKPVTDFTPIDEVYRDPETGYTWLHIRLPLTRSEALDRDVYDWESVKRLPEVLEFEGDIFVRTGWNSDTGRAYYRNHMLVAKRG